MTVVNAPKYWTEAIGRPDDLTKPSLFIAGGITGCPEWQKDVIDIIEARPRKEGSGEPRDVYLYNPRRPDFPIDDPEAAEEQIYWEYAHLRQATAILFWFPKETLCPIALFELGRWSYSAFPAYQKPIFVGTHPDYARRRDIEIQLRMTHPTATVWSRPDILAEAVNNWLGRLRYAQHLGWHTAT